VSCCSLPLVLAEGSPKILALHPYALVFAHVSPAAILAPAQSVAARGGGGQMPAYCFSQPNEK
jgi:hypothetical protein